MAETTCRNPPVDQSPRLIPWVQIGGRVLGELRTSRPVRVVDPAGIVAATGRDRPLDGQYRLGVLVTPTTPRAP